MEDHRRPAAQGLSPENWIILADLTDKMLAAGFRSRQTRPRGCPHEMEAQTPPGGIVQKFTLSM
jgi:hypothetical protein